MSDLRRRTWLVWVISIYWGVAALAGVYGTTRVLNAPDSMVGPSAEYIHQLRIPDYVMSFAGNLIGGLAAFALFRLKRVAWPMAIIIFAMGPILDFYRWLTKPAFSAYFQQMGYLALTTGLLVNGIILLYVWRLKRRGELSA